jgi:hypothetical protein
MIPIGGEGRNRRPVSLNEVEREGVPRTDKKGDGFVSAMPVEGDFEHGKPPITKAGYRRRGPPSLKFPVKTRRKRDS